MRYFTELLYGGRVIGQHSLNDLSDPDQAVKKTIINNNRSLPAFSMYVVNENGDMWTYLVRKENGKYTARKMYKDYVPLNKDDIDMIMAKNKTIHEVVTR